MRGLFDLDFALPRYLSEEKNDYLLKQLKDYPNMDNTYATFPENYWMQGDVYREIMYCDLVDGEYKTDKIEAMLLSNTCDISLENRRDFYDPKFVFAPIIYLENYYEMLVNDGHNIGTIETHIDAIRKQDITSFFYIPRKSFNDKEKFARFDMVFSVYLKDMKLTAEQMLRNRILSFSNKGFYILLYKISRHFTRILEAVDRG